MASSYPGGTDSFATNHLTGDVIQAGTDNDQADAINKIEAELGVNPSGPADTVVARWNALPVNASDYQPSGTSDNTALQNAAAAACAAGRGLFIPRRASEWVITAPIAITAPIKVFSDWGVIRQSTWGKPVFDLLTTDDVEVEGFYLRSTETRVYDGTAFRGDSATAYSAGVWAAGDRCKAHRLRISGFSIGTHFTNWTSGSSHSGRMMDNIVQDIVVDTVDLGVLMVDQDHPHVENIRGSYVRSTGSSDPAHLVYITGNYGGAGTDTRGMTGGNWHAFDSGASDGDPAFQLRKVVSSGLGALTARACGGVLTYEQMTSVGIDRIVSLDDRRADENGSLFAIDALSSRIRFKTVIISKGVSGRSIKINGTDVVVIDATVETNRPTTNTNEDVRIDGTRCGIERLVIRNAASSTTGANGVNVASGTDNFVFAPDIKNIRNGIMVTAGAVGTRLVYDSDLIVPETGFAKVSDAGTGTRQFQTESKGLKPPVRVAATGNVTISAPGATIDGVTMSAGPPPDRVLLPIQDAPQEQGIYVWNGAAVPMTRAVDSDTAAKITDSLLVTVDEGTVNRDSVWTLSTNKPITVGTTSLRFTRIHPAYPVSSQPPGTYWQPTNSKIENMPRDQVPLTNQALLTTQIVRVFPLGVLRAGDTLTALNFLIGTTGAATVTNSWAGIARFASRVVVGVSATSTAAPAANTVKTFTLASPLTADRDELLVGFVMYQATTVPSLLGINHGGTIVMTNTPVMNGTSNTGATTPVAFASTLTAFTADTELPYCYAT